MVCLRCASFADPLCTWPTARKRSQRRIQRMRRFQIWWGCVVGLLCMLRPLCRDLFPLMDIHNLGDLFFSFNKFIYIYIYILKNRVESRRFSSVETKEEIKEIPRMFRVLRGRGVPRIEKICVVCATCYISCGKNSLRNRRHLFLTGTEEILYI